MSQELLPKRTLGKRLALASFGIGFALFLVFLLEMLLALLNLGEASLEKDPFFDFEAGTGLFEPFEEEGRTWMRTREPKLQFFNMQTFTAEKDEDVFRVFALGGSTTFGRPYNWRIAFPNWTQTLLNAAGPNKRVEVINCGGVSYASYRVAVLMEELNRYEPDLFLVYSGHNEFLEERSYGAMLRQPGALKFLRKLRTTRLMESLVKSGEEKAKQEMPAEVKAKLDVWNGLASFTRDDAQKEAILKHYELNINRMIDLAQQKKIPILFIEPASNIKDFSPFKWEPGRGLSPQQAETVAAHLDSARNLLQNNQNSQALDHLQKGLEIDPEHAGIHYLMGRVQLQLKHKEQAARSFLMARDLDICPLRSLSAMNEILARVTQSRNIPLIPLDKQLRQLCREEQGHEIPGDPYFLDHVHPRIEIHQFIAERVVEQITENGWISLQKELKDQDRKVLYEKVIEELDQAYYAKRDLNLARVLGWAGKYEEATRALLRSREQLMGNPDMHFNLGVLYERQNKMEEAIAEYQWALAAEPDFFEAQFNMGKAYQALEKHQEASRAFRTALTLKPQEWEVRFNLALSLFRDNQIDDAENALAELEKINPTYSGLDRLKGRIYLRQEKTEQALVLLTAHAADNPSSAEAHYYHGLALARSGKLEEGLQAFGKTLEQNPQFSEAWRNIAKIHEMQDRETEAIQAYEKAAELAPRDALVVYELGLLHHKKGRLEMALKQYQQAAERDGNFAEAYNNQGVILGILKNYDQAIEAFQKTVALNYSAKDAHYNLAQLYLMQGREKEAVHHLKRAMSLGVKPSDQILKALEIQL